MSFQDQIHSKPRSCSNYLKIFSKINVLAMKMKIGFILAILFFVIPFLMGQNFPKMEESVRIKKLDPPKGKVRMVLDTDTYNEIDDQYALSYAYLSKEKLHPAAKFWSVGGTLSGVADLLPLPACFSGLLRILNSCRQTRGFCFRLQMPEYGCRFYLKTSDHG